MWLSTSTNIITICHPTLYKRLYLVEPLWKLRLPLDGSKCHLFHLLIIHTPDLNFHRGQTESPPSNYYIGGSTESPPSNYYIGSSTCIMTSMYRVLSPSGERICSIHENLILFSRISGKISFIEFFFFLCRIRHKMLFLSTIAKDNVWQTLLVFMYIYSLLVVKQCLLITF